MPSAFVSALLVFALTVAPVSTQVASQSPQPLALLQQSLNAMVGSTTVSDITLTGTAERIAGSDDESGSATLKAVSNGSASLAFAFPSGNRSETTNLYGVPAGTWSGPDGVSHSVAFHNLLCEPGWFFPAFMISRRIAPSFTVNDLGPVVRNGEQVEHLSVSQNPPLPDPQGGVPFQHLSQVDFFIDSQTHVPAWLTYNIHPDYNAGQDIPIEVDFSDYRATSGVQIPFHIQKFINNTLMLDVQLQSAAVNSGLSASAFSIQ